MVGWKRSILHKKHLLFRVNYSNFLRKLVFTLRGWKRFKGLCLEVHNILYNLNPDLINSLKGFVLKRINQRVKNCLFTNASSKNYLFDVYVHKQSEVVEDLEFPRRFSSTIPTLIIIIILFTSLCCNNIFLRYSSCFLTIS